MASLGTRRVVRPAWDRARFYWINGRPLPSVTTILDVIAKPALGPWYAKEERRQMETALLEVLVRPGPADREAYKTFVLEQLATAITGVKAAERAYFGRLEHPDRFGVNTQIGLREHRRTRGVLVRASMIPTFVRLPLQSDSACSTRPIQAFIPDRCRCSRLTDLSVHVGAKRAAERVREQAATIGTAVHAGIEWQLRTQLGEAAGPEPLLPEPAAWAVESWKDWARSVELDPLALERVVYCEDCGYAGTMDLYARVKGVPTVLDWKTGRAIYLEAFLQNVAYRHAAARLGMPAEQGMVVRLPKRLDDPAWEAMAVPRVITLEEFLAALRLWRWQRRMEGKAHGRAAR